MEIGTFMQHHIINHIPLFMTLFSLTLHSTFPLLYYHTHAVIIHGDMHAKN